jgi:hypothetical protein
MYERPARLRLQMVGAVWRLDSEEETAALNKANGGIANIVFTPAIFISSWGRRLGGSAAERPCDSRANRWTAASAAQN